MCKPIMLRRSDTVSSVSSHFSIPTCPCNAPILSHEEMLRSASSTCPGKPCTVPFRTQHVIIRAQLLELMSLRGFSRQPDRRALTAADRSTSGTLYGSTTSQPANSLKPTVRHRDLSPTLTIRKGSQRGRGRSLNGAVTIAVQATQHPDVSASPATLKYV